MKKFFLLVVFLSLVFLLNAQRTSNFTWFSISAKGGYGSSLLFNKPSFDDNNITYSFFSPSYFFGGRFGLLFGEFVGVSAELSMNYFSQEYDISSNIDFQRVLKANSFDYGFMLNLQTNTGFFFDIGPKFSTLKSAQLTTITENSDITLDRIAKFRPEFSSLAFGIGLKPVMTQIFEVKLGLRGAYTFSNFVNDPGYIIAADDNTLYYPLYIDEKTNPIQLMFQVELTYVFGRFGKASCGKYRFMINQ